MAQSVQTPASNTAHHEPTLVRGLSLMDSVMLMVGGIIGSGIFLTAGQIATAVHKPLYFLGVWIVGGLISLLACFAFAEMAAMYPEAGGQYVYLREAYGEFPAFLYGWMIFTVGQSGTIAALAVGFAEYFGAILPFASAHKPVATFLGWTLTRGHLVSTGAIILLTIINILGLKRGSALVNAATWAKFAAIGIFVLLGLAIGKGSWSNYAVSLAARSTGVAVARDFRLRRRADRSVLGVRRMGLHHLGFGRDQEPAEGSAARPAAGHSAGRLSSTSASASFILYALPITQVANETTIAQAAAVALFSSNAAKWLGATIALSCFGAASSAILVQRPRDLCHGARWRFLSRHGTRSSQVPNACIQPDRDRSLVDRAGAQRQLRPALHLRHVHDGAVVRGRQSLRCLSCAANVPMFLGRISAPDIRTCLRSTC